MKSRETVSSSESATALQRAPDGKWLSSGNPAGRPLGSRHKIADAIIRDIAAEWERSGAEVLERMARDEPAKFAQLAAGLIPKDILLSVTQRMPGNLTFDQLAHFGERL
jgi:hypothetical protein